MFEADELSKEELIVWMSHPCTQTFIRELTAERQEIMDMWAKGSFTHESSEGTAQSNAEALGRIKAIGAVLDVIEEIKEEASNEGS